MQAIILAGGFGTRLKSAISDVPKPMAPVGGRAFLFWLLEYMEEQGVREAVLCLHHQASQIQQTLGSRFGGMNLRYSIEENPLGTGGAIHQALKILNPDKPLFVLNGDSLVELNYRAMMKQHISSGRPITIASRMVPDCRRYSQLTTENGTIKNYELYGDNHAGNISTGFYVVSPELFEGWITPNILMPEFEGLGEGAFSFERDFLAPLTPELRPAMYDDVGYFIDIGVPEDYARAQTEIPAIRGMVIAA